MDAVNSLQGKCKIDIQECDLKKPYKYHLIYQQKSKFTGEIQIYCK